VARLVELPQWQRGTIRPWSGDEAKSFLAAAKPDPLHAAFVLLIFYGLRRGESLGLRWDDIDFDAGTIKICQQLQRIRGELLLAPVKTNAGKRNLPLLDLVRDALKLQEDRQAAYRIDMGSAWPETGLVFTTRTATPSSRATSSDPSGVSATATAYGSSRSITCETRSVRYSRI
jgi:integrase